METNHLNRSKSIGGSDAPIIVLPKSKYKSRYQLWLEKTEQVEPADLSEFPWIEWGLRLEKDIAQKFIDDTGFEVDLHPEKLTHPDYPFITGSLDGLGIDDEGTRFVFESKTTKWGAGWEGNNIPIEYQIQLAHYMMLADCPYAFIAVLIGGSDYRVLKVLRDLELESIMLSKEIEFWEMHVVPRIAPEIDTVEDFNSSVDKHQGEIIVADSLVMEYADRYQDIQSDIKQLEAEKEDMKLKIIQAMGSAEMLDVGSVYFKYTPTDMTRLDYTRLKSELPHIAEKYSKTSKTFILRIIKKKGE